jgi:hypothetical protein
VELAAEEEGKVLDAFIVLAEFVTAVVESVLVV